jgi:redox-sensing transcriptional repressor
MGSALLAFERFAYTEFRVAAGFDTDINKIETLVSSVPLFPAHEITDVVKRLGIEIGVIAVPQVSAQEVADRLINGGVKGILNFTQAIIKHDSSKVMVEHVDIIREFTVISARISLAEKGVSSD